MTDGKLLAAFDLLPYQFRAICAPARFTWNCWARQTGKTFTFALRRLIAALLRRRTQIILSAGLRQSREAMLKLRQHCRTLRIHSDLQEKPFYRDLAIRQLEITLPSGVRLIGLPANPLTARGYTGDVFLDEFAMHRDADEIWSALFPTLLRGEGELDVASTPRGRKNLFARLRDNRHFTRITVALADAVAEGLKIDVEEMRAGIGDELAWRQEFCCEFADEATAFLPFDLIERCCDEALTPSVNWAALARPGAEIYLGVDLGRKQDLTVVWIWQRLGEELVTRGVIVMDQIPFNEQEAQLAAILNYPGVVRCAVDATGIGHPVAEQLASRHGSCRIEPVHFSAGVKAQLAGKLRMAAERGQLRIPRDKQIIDDWHAIERIVSSGCHVRYDAPRGAGGHGDRFWAAALGIHAAGEPPKPLDYVTTAPLRFAGTGAL